MTNSDAPRPRPPRPQPQLGNEAPEGVDVAALVAEMDETASLPLDQQADRFTDLYERLAASLDAR